MWLNRNTKVLDSFPPQKWLVYACSMWSDYSVFGKWCSHHRRQKNYGSHTIARVHNIARLNCSTGTYFFLKHWRSGYDNLSYQQLGVWRYVHHFLYQHQYWLFFPLATDSDDNHLSAKQYRQLQSFECPFSISALLVDSREIPFSICSKILLQYVVHIAISFLSMHLVC